MKTEFEVTYHLNGLDRERLIRAKNVNFAERWMRHIEPKATVLHVANAQFSRMTGRPIEEVPDDWNGIVFDGIFDNSYSGERTLYFDVPLEYLGRDYFAEEYRETAFSATISIGYDPDYPSYEESAFDVAPTDIDGSDLDWFRYDMSLEEYQMFMNIAKEAFRHTINVSFVHGTDEDDPETGETQFDLDDEDGDYSDVELFNLIIDFFKENHFIDPYVTGIWEV